MSDATSLYRFYDNTSDLLYVGVTLNIPQRWTAHRGGKSWWGQITRVSLEHFETRQEALLAESAAIITERPRFNVVGTGPRRQQQSPSPADDEDWQKVITLEPRLLLVEWWAKRAPHDPQDWYGYDGHSLNLREAMSRLAGWGRGEGWAYFVPARPAGVSRLNSPEWKAYFEELDRRRVPQQEADANSGHSWLWSKEAYDAAYDHLYRLVGRAKMAACPNPADLPGWFPSISHRESLLLERGRRN